METLSAVAMVRDAAGCAADRNASARAPQTIRYGSNPLTIGSRPTPHSKLFWRRASSGVLHIKPAFPTFCSLLNILSACKMYILYQFLPTEMYCNTVRTVISRVSCFNLFHKFRIRVYLNVVNIRFPANPDFFFVVYFPLNEI